MLFSVCFDPSAAISGSSDRFSGPIPRRGWKPLDSFGVMSGAASRVARKGVVRTNP